MKYLKLFESFNELKIHKICKKYGIEDYSINTDGSIDVDGIVRIPQESLTKLPLKFNKVNGYFNCHHNKLTSLERSPVEVNGSFYCSGNLLTSFEYAPRIIRSTFDCESNNIKTFEYFPKYVRGEFWCDGNPIHQIWWLFKDVEKIELLNDFDIFRDEDTDTPSIVMDRLNDFLLTIDKKPVKSVKQYKKL